MIFTLLQFGWIGAVILLVSDIKRSIRFYSNILGMELKSGSIEWTEFSMHSTVRPFHHSKKRINKNNGILIDFSISDLDDIINRLKKKSEILQKAQARVIWQTCYNPRP